MDAYNGANSGSKVVAKVVAAVLVAVFILGGGRHFTGKGKT
jgi:hypothetical protein